VNVIAIDPGNRTGIARVVGGVPHVRVVSRADALTFALDAWTLAQAGARDRYDVIAVIEVPRFHGMARSKGDPNDLIKLAELAGRIAGALEAHGCAVERVEPHQWKGLVPKAVHQARVLRDLGTVAVQSADAMRSRDQWLQAWQSVDHNGRDALALARWRLLQAVPS
jgi:hypothetical protein